MNDKWITRLFDSLIGISRFLFQNPFTLTPSIKEKGGTFSLFFYFTSFTIQIFLLPPYSSAFLISLFLLFLYFFTPLFSRALSKFLFYLPFYLSLLYLWFSLGFSCISHSVFLISLNISLRLSDISVCLFALYFYLSDLSLSLFSLSLSPLELLHHQLTLSTFRYTISSIL